MGKTDYQYDVFISHAVEDKLPIANDLYEHLCAKDLTVWYSGNELSVGDRLTDSIHKSLNLCRFGVVIISPTYLSKIWALNEFFFLLNKEENGHKVILPVLYNITPGELASRSTLMAEMFAVRAENGLESVTEALYQEIQKQREIEKKAKKIRDPLPFMKAKPSSILYSVVLLLAVTVGGMQFFSPDTVPENIETTITHRIEELQQKADADLQYDIQTQHARPASDEEVKLLYQEFVNTKSYYRNEYVLNTGYETIRSRKNVSAAMAFDLESISPANLYSFTKPAMYVCEPVNHGYRENRYVFYNTQPVTFSTEEMETTDDTRTIKVSYVNPARLIQVSLTLPASSNGIKRHQMSITALKPIEVYSFIREGNTWVLKTVE